MKTTIEIPDELFVEAKKHAAELRVPLRQLVEEGLRARLAILDETPRVREYEHAISRKERWERALKATTRFGSRTGDLARNHDKYLLEDLSR